MTQPATVFATGGASGIGFAVVEAALAQGWRVVVADVDPGKLEECRLSHRERAPSRGAKGETRFVQLDVTDEPAVQDAIARCDAEFGPLVGLVNSAGIAADVPCLETSTALFRKILEVNVIGSFVASREAALRMREHGRESIVNIASVSGIRGNTG